MSFGMYARNVIAGQGRYVADKAPETKEPTVSNPYYSSAIDMMEKIGGSFAKAIAQAYYVADMSNRAKLVAAFPALFAKYEGMYKLYQVNEENTK